jgi:heat shock protein HslJ
MNLRKSAIKQPLAHSYTLKCVKRYETNMRNILLLGLVIAFAASLPSYASDIKLEGKWQITAIKGVDELDSSKTEFVVMEDGRIGMSVGCNRMTAKPEIEGDKITFGPIPMTRMACLPPFDELEKQFTKALEATGSYALDSEENSLDFFDADGAPVISFSRTDGDQ